LNYNYWTAGTQKGLTGGQWSWCRPGQSPQGLDDFLPWEGNLVDKQDCVHLKIGRNKANVSLTGKNCTSKFIYACQVKFLIIFHNLNLQCFVLKGDRAVTKKIKQKESCFVDVQ